MVSNIFYFSIYWECHHPNWLSYFSRWLKHVKTTNQYWISRGWTTDEVSLNACKSGKKSFGLGFTPWWPQESPWNANWGYTGIPYFQTDQYVDPFPFSLTLMLRTIMGHMFFLFGNEHHFDLSWMGYTPAFMVILMLRTWFSKPNSGVPHFQVPHPNMVDYTSRYIFLNVHTVFPSVYIYI